MKYVIILLLLDCFCLTRQSAIDRKGGIYHAMSLKGIDSIEVIYYHSLLSNSSLYIKIKKDSTYSFRLDSISRGEHTDDAFYPFVFFPAKLSDKSIDYLLSCVQAFFVLKTDTVYVTKKRTNANAETHSDQLNVYLYKGRRKHTMELLLGSVYSKVQDHVGFHIVEYTPSFRRFIQQIIYITATQGPYSERYHSAIESMKTEREYVVYDPIE